MILLQCTLIAIEMAHWYWDYICIWICICRCHIHQMLQNYSLTLKVVAYVFHRNGKTWETKVRHNVNYFQRRKSILWNLKHISTSYTHGYVPIMSNWIRSHNHHLHYTYFTLQRQRKQHTHHIHNIHTYDLQQYQY